MPSPNLVNRPNFTTNLKFDQLMIDAYHRCGIYRPTISGDQIDDAIRSANFILVDYNNRGSNLYSIQTEVMTLQNGVPSYSVPDFYEINDVTMANQVRQLGTSNNPGTAATPNGGIAANAFDGNPETSCQNTSINGQITYTFANNPVMMQFVGFQTSPNDTQTYNLQFFFQTVSGNSATKQIVYSTGAFTPFPGQPYYFFLNPSEKAVIWGVQEIGGATLNIAELYFSQYGNSRTISPLSRQNWMTLSNKNLTGGPAFPSFTQYPQLTRQLGTPDNPGTAFTPDGGIAQNAFDQNPATACVNTSPDGEITYTFAHSPVTIQVVGFQTAIADNQSYNLQFFYQTDPANPATKVINYTTGPITPVANQVYYYNLNVPATAFLWGIEEVGGATLKMAEIFFSSYSGLIPFPASPPSITGAFLPSPTIISSSNGFPAGYYVDRQPNPVINFYPMPGVDYPFCVFTYTSYFEQVTNLQQVLQIPGSFIPALTAELAMALGTKYVTDENRMKRLEAQRDESFRYATDEDRQKVNLQFQVDVSMFSTN